MRYSHRVLSVSVLVLSLLAGCGGDDEKKGSGTSAGEDTTSPEVSTPGSPEASPTAPKSSRSSSEAWRVSKDLKPLEVPSEPTGKPSWFRRGRQSTDRVQPDAVALETEKLYDKALSPADKDQTIQAGTARVTVPAGLLDQPLSLVVAKAKTPVFLPIKGTTPLQTWDIKLGDQHVFAKPLTLQFPMSDDVATQIAGRKQPLAAMHYNPSAKAWVSLPIAYDPKTQTATIQTRHLTVLTIVLRLGNSLLHDSVFTDHFSIFYSKDSILKDTEVNEALWGKKLLEDLATHGEPVGVAKQVDAQTIEVEGRDDVPTYIVYMAKALEYAWHRYHDVGFPVPTWTRTDIYVGVNSPLSDSNHRGKLLGTIEITPTATWQPTSVRVATAHEFFHTVQSNYLGLAIMSMNYRTWWLEALAEFAPRTVWGQTVTMKGMKPDFFRIPLPTADESHEYGASHLVRFIVNEKGISFRKLVDDTLTVPSGLLAMEEMSAPNFAVLKQLLGFDEPFDNYSASITCGMLDQVLRAKGSTLGATYAEFAAWAMFDTKCRALVADGDALLSFALGHHEIGGLALTDEKIEQDLSTRSAGTADIWAVKVENPMATATSTRQPRKVTVEAVGDIASLSQIDVYVLKKNARVAGGVKSAATLKKKGDTVDVSVGAADLLYIVASNCSSKPSTTKVRVSGGMDLRIEPGEVSDGETGKELTFRAVSDALPDTLEPGKLKVRWSPSGGVSTDVKQVGAGISAEYTYAWKRKGNVTLTAELLHGTERIAMAKAPIKVAAANEPTVTLEARSIIVPAGREFGISASVHNAPAGASYRWKLGYGKAQKTKTPQCAFSIPRAGERSILVAMLDANNRSVAQDKATITAEPGRDLVWIEDYDIRKGERVVMARYQAYRGTGIHHGQYTAYHYYGPHEGAVKEQRTYEEGIMTLSRTFYPNGSIRQVDTFNPQGRRDGEREHYIEDGRRTLMETYVDGALSGPFERLIAYPNTYRLERGRYTDGKLNGRLLLYLGNSKTGKQHLSKTEEYSGGQRNGTYVTFMPDGKVSGEANYRNGKPHGWSKIWYTSEIKAGIYYLMTELKYDNGKVVHERKYDRKGAIVLDKAR